MKAVSMNNELTVLQKILHGHADVFGNLPQQDGRKITPRVERDSGATAIRMPELLMRTALTNFLKPQPLQNRNDFAGLEDGDTGHSRNFDGLHSDELRFESRGAVLAQHLDDFLQIRVEFIERRGLRMRARKAGNIANIKSGIRATLDHCGIGFHIGSPLGSDTRHSSSLEQRA